MYDRENEKYIFWYFTIITGIMLIINIIACIFPNIKVAELMATDTNIATIKYAIEAIATLLFGAITSLVVDVFSWALPKTNVFKVYDSLENYKYKIICIVMTVILNLLTLYNGISSFLVSKELLIKSGYSLFDLVRHWMQNGLF